MNKVLTRFAVLILVVAARLAGAAPPEPRIVSIGDLSLQSGEVIRDCRIGFVTLGELNADRSNVIVFPTWFSGTYQDILPFVGSGKLVDSTKYFVVIVDALGDGVSASPSQAEDPSKFPQFTISDMVNSQHILLTRELGLTHVKAVMGISMGGLQTFQWMVSYPGFMDKAIAITATPRPTPSDLFLFHTWERALAQAGDLTPGSQSANAAMRTIASTISFASATPRYTNQQTDWEGFAEFQRQAENPLVQSLNPWNFRAQTRALISHNVAQDSPGGSLERAAAAVKAQVMVVVAAQDHMVNPAPALEFAKRLHAPTAVLEGDCGHRSVYCEQPKLFSAVREFLDR